VVNVIMAEMLKMPNNKTCFWGDVLRQRIRSLSNNRKVFSTTSSNVSPARLESRSRQASSLARED